jgi:hypothetical protein
MKYFVATVFIEHSPITLFPIIEAADAAEAMVGADLYLRYARAALELPAHHRDYVGSIVEMTLPDCDRPELIAHTMAEIREMAECAGLDDEGNEDVGEDEDTDERLERT